MPCIASKPMKKKTAGKQLSGSEMRGSEAREIDWERAFFDTRHIICAHLDFDDLHNLSSVNLVWNKIARKEIKKRDFIKFLALNYILRLIPRRGLDPIPELEPRIVRLDKQLNASPALSLLICDRKWRLFEDNVMLDMRKRLPSSMIMMLRVDKFLTADDVDLNTEDGLVKRVSQEADLNTLAGLFFPTDKLGTRVRMAWSRPNYTNATEEAHRIIEQLDVTADPSTYLLFSKHTERVTNTASFHLTRFLAEGRRYGCAEMWTGFGDNVGVAECHSSEPPEHPDVLVVKICGPDVRSWSTIIEATLPYEHIIDLLHAFKQRILPGRKCVGLVYAEVFGDALWKLVMLYVKLMFPDIPFVGMFGNRGRLPVRRGNPEEAGNQPAGPRTINDGLFNPLMSIIIVSIN